MIRTLVLGTLLTVSLSACSFHARGADDYRSVTRSLMQTRSGQLQSCYEQEIARDPASGGDVAVDFQVEAKTGKVLSPKVAAPDTTASEPLQRCVVTALDGLVLDPPDQRTAQARFVWSFERG